MPIQTPTLDQLHACIRAFCAGPANSLQTDNLERAWDEPLLGLAAGDDPLFQKYKEVVHPRHWTPLEALQAGHPELAETRPDEIIVICWILPQTAAVRADNRGPHRFAAERWARSRIYGERFNEKLRQHVVDWLEERGVPAVAPLLLPTFERVDGPYGYASLWSERHAAHAAGMGTFGLCDGLITPLGKAMRVGSVVARLALPPTPRPYSDHHAYCLHFNGGDCDACVGRCPAGALSAAGHDKLACSAHLRASADFVRSEYCFEGYGCGLCQVDVPCESCIPSPGNRR